MEFHLDSFAICIVATESFIDESYYVTEEEGPIQVNVTRSGNLQNTSVVLVATDNFRGSASGRPEFKLKKAYFFVQQYYVFLSLYQF